MSLIAIFERLEEYNQQVSFPLGPQVIVVPCKTNEFEEFVFKASK
jgi:hypothetical protein